MRELRVRRAYAFVSIMLGLALLASAKGRTTVDNVMEVWLNSSVQKVTGRPWPLGQGGQPLGMTAAEEPWEVVVHLPSGRTFRLRSIHTTLQQERGIVNVISMLPLAQPVDFKSAIDRLEEIARGQKIEERKFYEIVSSWREAPPVQGAFAPKYMARTQIEAGVNLYASIKPAGTSADSWFVVLEFQKAVSRP
jgi:hypothetical protein